MKKLLTLILCFALLLTFTSCSEVDKKVQAQRLETKEESTENLKVHFIDVGQGDCILLQMGNENMIIDGGTNESERAIRNYLNDLKIEKLDYVIGTHAHEDHIGSLDYIINSFNIGEVYFPKQVSSTKCFESFIDICKKKNLKLKAPAVGEKFSLGKAECEILAPSKENYKDINDSSIVLKVTYGNNSFIFTGDAGVESEKEMLQSGIDLKADVLKVGHHGSKSATSNEFLNAVNPEYAVISVGMNNDYNLPNVKTMDKLKKKNIKVYRTDECGSIICQSDGTNITFNTKEGSYNQGEGSSETTTNYDEDEEESNNSENPIVYWTDGGKSYHYDSNCSALKNSKNIRIGNLSECPKKDPCDRCVK